ncbi:MAG: signal peptidase I [Bacilli bacterium]|nr:signal peptidase I [Bacilli bacterium]
MKKNLILYALLIVYILANIFLIPLTNITFFNYVLNPLIWIIIVGIAYLLSKGESLRYKDQMNKTQSIIVALIIYTIFYFLLGLVFGYQKTPYSKEFLLIIGNLWAFGSIIFLQEYVRNAMIRIEHKNIFNFIIIALLFSFVNISYTGLANHLNDIKEIFMYTTSIIIPLFVTNAVLTYFSYIGGMRIPTIYRCIVFLPEFLVPIIPSLDWFVTAVIGISLPIAVFVYVSYIHIIKTERMSRRTKRKYNPVVYVPTFALIAVVVCFVIGVFKYQPVAILSGSMSPVFNRGDAVIIKKLSRSEKDELNKGDIIQFVNGSKYVVHRIAEVTNDQYGNRVFITKGDANNANDIGKVEYDSVVGEASFIIPYIGYPSVWLSGMMS